LGSHFQPGGTELHALQGKYVEPVGGNAQGRCQVGCRIHLRRGMDPGPGGMGEIRERDGVRALKPPALHSHIASARHTRWRISACVMERCAGVPFSTVSGV
jgi:hypothetical protein